MVYQTITLCFSNKRSVGQHKIDLAVLPFVAGFYGQRSRQAQAGRFIRKDARHTGAPADLLVQPFQRVHRVQARAVRRQQTERYQESSTIANIHRDTFYIFEIRLSSGFRCERWRDLLCRQRRVVAVAAPTVDEPGAHADNAIVPIRRLNKIYFLIIENLKRRTRELSRPIHCEAIDRSA